MSTPGYAAGGALAAGAALVLARRWFEAQAVPDLYHADTPQARALIAACAQQLLRTHRPHVLLEAAGALSSAAMLARPRPAIGWWRARELELVPLADGGTARLDWSHPPAGLARARGVVLLLPGLNNSSSSSYIQHTMAHLGRCGLSAACIDYRGVGGLALTSARVGCVDSWRDLADAMRAVRAALAAAGNPSAPLAAIGFSMGGTMLAKYLSMPSLEAPFVCAVTVSSPFDLAAAKKTLESGWSKRLLNFGLTQVVKLRFASQRDSRAHLAGIDWPAFLSSGSLRALEEATICKLHGYDDAAAYYRLNQPDFAKIETPLLCLHALDDPMVHMEDLPLAAMAANPRVALAVTRRGGHLGWTAGTMRGPCAPTWADKAATQFVLHHCAAAAHVGDSNAGADGDGAGHGAAAKASESARAWGTVVQSRL